jgi:hypothetical protein
MWHVPLLRVYGPLPGNGSTCYISPSTYRCTTLSSFPEVCACDICNQYHLPSLWFVSHSDRSPIAPTAPALRPLIPSSSLIRCKPVQVYHHQPLSRVPFWSVWAKVLRVVNVPTSLTLKLLVVFSFVSEGANPSTGSSHSVPITRWKTRLLTSWPPVRRSAWQSCWMPSCFLDIAAISGLGPLCHS